MVQVRAPSVSFVNSLIFPSIFLLKVALEHKEFGDNQKKKVKEFREFNSKLHDDIDGLEEDIKAKDEFVTKLTRERNKLQAELKYWKS